jgi:concentrative nucleoside transporter, CNT family
MQPKLISLMGIGVFLVLAWSLSLNRKRFPWKTVWSGLALQFAFAVLILKTNAGHRVFEFAQAAFMKLIDFSMEGARMVFGPLADQDFLTERWGSDHAFVFVITVSATIIVVSALSALLYHYGILQWVVRGAAWIMQRVMRTSGSESLAAAGNIFMGQTEAPLVILPYLPRMTQSELMALMVGGMATIAGGVLAAYVAFGERAGRLDMAGHLLTASVMSAPAGLLMAKIILPETEPSETAAGATAAVERTTSNGLDALCRGASDGLKLALNVMAMLIAFVAVVALINFLLAWPQELLFHWVGIEAQPVTLQRFFGWINAPFAWLMGVPPADCGKIGQVLGERIVTNEFLGYLNLTDMNKLGSLQSRSFTLATYALCGFANFASIAIQIGGIGALVPERRRDLARLGLRAMLGGLLTCYLTAALVGLLT